MSLINYDESYLLFSTDKVRLLPSGEIMAYERFTIKSFCIIASEFYPMDQHECWIMTTFKGTTVKISSAHVILNKRDINSRHNKWWVHSPKVSIRDLGKQRMDFHGKTDRSIYFTFAAARLYDHEMKNVVFPIFLVGLIAALSIMIPGLE